VGGQIHRDAARVAGAGVKDDQGFRHGAILARETPAVSKLVGARPRGLPAVKGAGLERQQAQD
jgi:hypothetical protein